MASGASTICRGKNQIVHHDADLGDVRLHYVTAGAGESVVLLHGWPETSFQWRKVMPLLAERYHVIAPDLRGLGDSSTPESGYDKHSLAEDVWRLMREVLGCESWYLAGHSWGAVAAYSMAAAHPDAVRRLAVDVAPLRKGHEYNAWWHLFNQLPNGFPEALIQGREALYFGWFYRNFTHPSFVMPDEVIDEYLRTYVQPEHVRAALAYYHSMPEDIIRNTELARRFKLPMPVLAFCGEGPFVLTGEKITKNHVAEAMRELAVDVTEVMFAEAGYLLHEEEPQLLAETLGTFFAGSKPPPLVA